MVVLDSCILDFLIIIMSISLTFFSIINIKTTKFYLIELIDGGICFEVHKWTYNLKLTGKEKKN